MILSDTQKTCLFSATLYSDEIKELSKQICKNPIWVDLKGRNYVPPSVQQVNLIVDVTDVHQRGLYTYGGPLPFTDSVHPSQHLGNVLRTPEEKSEATKRAKLQLVQELVDKYKMDRVIIFCRTNLDCNNLEAFFNTVGHGQKLEYFWKVRSMVVHIILELLEGAIHASCWQVCEIRVPAITR